MNQAAEERWKREQDYFDAVEYHSTAIPAPTVERYRKCAKPFLVAENPFHTLGDLTGKRVLEVGCGDGGNSILLSLRGAREVVGIELSEKAVEAARLRAKAHGLSEAQIRFVNAPLEQFLAENPTEKFDVICGWAVLHHMLPVLAEVIAQMRSLGHADTVFLFVEPIALSTKLRQFRLSLPISVSGTPDERPLETQDLVIIEGGLGTMKKQYFQALSRLSRFWGGGNYELGGATNRLVYDLLSRIDWFLLGTLQMTSLGSVVVLTAQPGRSGRSR